MILGSTNSTQALFTEPTYQASVMKSVGGRRCTSFGVAARMLVRITPYLAALALGSLPTIAAASDVAVGTPALVVPQPVQEVMRTYCYDCHGEKKSKGEVRLDQLSMTTGKVRLDVMGRMEEQIYFEQMPPEDKKQPTPAERALLAAYVRDDIIKAGVAPLEDKLRYPNYGNAVDHEKLFSGEIKTKAFTPARRWLINPQIFTARVIDIFNIKGEPRDKFMHWPNNSMLSGVSNPFILPEVSGVRDYDINSLDGGHLLTMISNAEWITKKQTLPARNKKKGVKPNEPEDKADKFVPSETPAAIEKIILQDSRPSDEDILEAIKTQFGRVLWRAPTDSEQAKYLGLTRTAIDIGGNAEGIRQMMVAVVLESEFLYRLEFGEGPADKFGRKKLSPREASYAISYALGDWAPDAALIKAAQEGRLVSKEDYQREVKRLLEDPEYYKIEIDHSLSEGKGGRESAYTAQPRSVRFFRDFFGYFNAPKVFKDKNRSNGYYENPGRGTTGTGGMLVREADLIVDYYVRQDQNVFENLLGTEVFFVAPLDRESGLQVGKVKETSTVADKVAALNKFYDLMKDTDWKKNPKQVIEANKNGEAVAIFKKHLEWNGPSEKSLPKVMEHVQHFRELGINPNPDWGYAFNIGNLMPWLNSYDINPAKWEYAQRQPVKLANRKGILTHPAWLVAHSANDHTDPIRRGRWIQEKLLAGRVPDVPITVEAKVPDNPHMTLRERVESVTEQSTCWNCHQLMNPLGYPFERYDDFGRYRAEEPLENPENMIAKAKDKYGANTYKTKAVKTDGVLRGTGDKALDGPVKDALDLIDRLAKSTRVRQSIIRHAFRFYLGRNEMLSDSQTLIDADKAYVSSGGSFKAVIVSLLTSDSFMYRK